MEVYIEVTYLINGFILMVVFEMMAILLNVEWQWKKIIGYSCLCNISLLVIYMNQYLYLSFFIWLIVFLIIFKKQIFLYYPIFLIVYFSVLLFVKSLIVESFIYNGVLITPTNFFDMTVVIVCIFFSIMQVMFLIYLKKKIMNQTFIYDVRIKYDGKTYRLTGFLDSGNEAFYQGYPLIFFKKSLFEQYQVIDQITLQPAMIEADIIKIESMTINHQTIHDIYAGLIDHIEYDCLLNKQLMGGVI